MLPYNFIICLVYRTVTILEESNLSPKLSSFLSTSLKLWNLLSTSLDLRNWLSTYCNWNCGTYCQQHWNCGTYCQHYSNCGAYCQLHWYRQTYCQHHWNCGIYCQHRWNCWTDCQHHWNCGTYCQHHWNRQIYYIGTVMWTVNCVSFLYICTVNILKTSFYVVCEITDTTVVLVDVNYFCWNVIIIVNIIVRRDCHSLPSPPHA